MSSEKSLTSQVCEGEELLWRDLWILMLDAESSEMVFSSKDGWTRLRILHIQEHLCMPSLRRLRAYVRLEGFCIPHSAEWTCELAPDINTTSVMDMD